MESQTYEKVCEFEMIPTYQIFYNEESMFGIYAFCTKDQIPQFSPYNDNLMTQEIKNMLQVNLLEKFNSYILGQSIM